MTTWPSSSQPTMHSMRTVRLEFGRAETEGGRDSEIVRSAHWVLGSFRCRPHGPDAGVGMSRGKAASIASAQTAGAPFAQNRRARASRGPPGKRFDYLTIDEDDNYLLSAPSRRPDLLHVIDLKTNAVVKTIRDVPGVEGVAYIAEGKKVYTANWGRKQDRRSSI